VAQPIREASGYLLARATQVFPPWWRFRLYHHIHKRLLGNPYWCDGCPDSGRWTKVQPHGYEMELFASDWMERYALHTGTFYCAEVLEVVATVLHAGDCFVDIGANIGFVTLCASRIVGERGRILSFEPNVGLVARLERALSHNGILNVTVLPYAAGSESREIGFSQDAHHGNNHVIEDMALASVVVPMRRVDDIIRDKLPATGNVMVKIDVEGAEMLALLGMPELVCRPRTTFLVEMCDEWLHRNGSSASSIFGMMTAAGYSAFLPSFSPMSSKLSMRPLIALPPREKVYDVLFRRPAKAANQTTWSPEKER
jgi:FkbM family methyltransferase